jgi:xanthine dehydrogenase accessory factor
MEPDKIYRMISQLQEERESFAVVTVIAAKGSTPRGPGAKMIVLEDGRTFGTVGGSVVESLVVKDAVTAIRENRIIRCEHNLNDLEKTDTGMICGGKMEFYIEPVKATPRLIIFGGGHCGLPLAKVASLAGFECALVEDRPEFATRDRFPDADTIIVAEPDEALAQISFGGNDFVAIVTRNHEFDYRILKNVIGKGLRYIGLIGSKAKKAQIYKKLEKDGISKSELARIHCPIGLEIGAESPEEIAVSIVAELIAVKKGLSGAK